MPATPAVMLKVTVVPSTELLVAMKLFVGAIVESTMGRAAVGIWKAVLGVGVEIAPSPCAVGSAVGYAFGVLVRTGAPEGSDV